MSIRFLLPPALSAVVLSGMTAAETPPIPEIRCPLADAPLCDGRVGADEWSDALLVRDFEDPWAYDAMADQVRPEYPPDDLACRIRVKHDGERFYMLCEVRDDVLYNVDTDQWAPTDGGDRTPPYWHSPGDAEDWGWWGDCVELAVCANMSGDYEQFPYTGPVDPARAGECWKVQGNASYGKLMVGDVLEAWAESGAMQCAVRRTDDGYVTEWSVAFDPCFATGEGAFYRPGESAPMGLQLIVLDVDRRQDGEGHWSNIHHQAVWSYRDAGGKKQRGNWGRLILLPPPAPVRGSPHGVTLTNAILVLLIASAVGVGAAVYLRRRHRAVRAQRGQ